MRCRSKNACAHLFEHVLLSPMWLSAMTGYMALSEPTLRLEVRSFIGRDNLRACDLIVRDGDRIRLSENACFPINDDPALFARMHIGQGCEIVPKPGCEWWSAAACKS